MKTTKEKYEVLINVLKISSENWDICMRIVECIESFGYRFNICRNFVEISHDYGSTHFNQIPFITTKENTKLLSIKKAIEYFHNFYGIVNGYIEYNTSDVNGMNFLELLVFSEEDMVIDKFQITRDIKFAHTTLVVTKKGTMVIDNRRGKSGVYIQSI